MTTTEQELAEAVALIKRTTDRRNELIVQLRSEHATLFAIAIAADLTPGGVSDILRRQKIATNGAES